MKRDLQKWLCLDCGKDTFLDPNDYYFLRHRLWRSLVPREQRHGMICRDCIALRLGRPLEAADLFDQGAPIGIDPEDQPMEPEDYGIIDTLTPNDLLAIQNAALGFLAAQPKGAVNGSALVTHLYDSTIPGIPPLPDWFYIDCMEELVDQGILAVTSSGEDWLHGIVTKRSDSQKT